MVADAGESDEFITPQDHQRWMSMQVPFHTGEGFLTFGEGSRGKTKFGRLCFTAKTNNNKPGKAKGKSPAAKAKKTTIKKVAPKKKTTKARGHKVTHLHAANRVTHLDQPR
jgi:hypothetical protein